jgi:hypothetical protein
VPWAWGGEKSIKGEDVRRLIEGRQLLSFEDGESVYGSTTHSLPKTEKEYGTG